MKIRLSNDRFIFIMRFPLAENMVFILKRGHDGVHMGVMAHTSACIRRYMTGNFVKS